MGLSGPPDRAWLQGLGGAVQGAFLGNGAWELGWSRRGAAGCPDSSLRRPDLPAGQGGGLCRATPRLRGCPSADRDRPFEVRVMQRGPIPPAPSSAWGCGQALAPKTGALHQLAALSWPAEPSSAATAERPEQPTLSAEFRTDNDANVGL